MSLFLMIVCLAAIAGALYLVNVKWAAMNRWMRYLISGLLIFAAVYMVLRETGLWDLLMGIKVPHV